MHESVVDAVVPGILGQGLQKARRARGLTQQEVADSLELARTTVTALEKGERRIRPDELISLAGLYGRPGQHFRLVQGLAQPKAAPLTRFPGQRRSRPRALSSTISSALTSPVTMRKSGTALVMFASGSPLSCRRRISAAA